MTSDPQQPPPASGPEAGPAKPSEPGPKEPPSIAASILPQSKRDSARHPEGDAQLPEALRAMDDITAAEQIAVEAPPQPNPPQPKRSGS
jgi:hypothetical protein